jgi:hypothetical protein
MMKREKYILTKAVQKQLKVWADKLPIVMYTTHEWHYLKGHEVLDMFESTGADTIEGIDIPKTDIVPDGTYRYPFPVQIAINHYRKLKKAWLKSGSEGVKKYVDNLAIH